MDQPDTVEEEKIFRSSGTSGSEWAEGFYDDGWLQPSATLHIHKATRVELDLFLPEIEGQDGGARDGALYVNDTRIRDISIPRGEISTITLELDNAYSLKKIELRFDGVESVTSDARQLACLCIEVRIARLRGQDSGGDDVILPENHMFAVDRLVVVAGVGVFVEGWSLGLGDGDRELWLTLNDTPAGEILREAFHFPRNDLTEVFNSKYGDAVETAGFAAFVPTDKDPFFQGEVRLDAYYRGAKTMDGTPNVRTLPAGRAAAIEMLKFPFLEKQGMLSYIDKHLEPAISRIPYTRSEDVKTDIVQYGTRPRAPRLSVVIPLYGRYDFMETQLALFADDPAFHTDVELIYVVDDPRLERGIRISSVLYEQLFGVPFTVVYYDKNLGYAGANNVGAAEARAAHLLLLNSDVFPAEPGWCARMIDRLDSLPDCGALGARLLYADGSLQHDGINYVPASFLEDLQICDHPGKGGPAMPVDDSTRTAHVPCTTGACLMVRREDYMKVGGFDEGFLIGDFEDSDLCLALTALDRKIYVARDIVLYHLERQSQSMVSQDNWKHQLTIYNCRRHQQKWNDLLSKTTKWA